MSRSDLGHHEGTLKKCDIRGRDDGELHQQHPSTRDHPGGWNDCVPKGGDVLDDLTIHQVCSAFDLDDGLISADGVMAVLEMEAKSEMGGVLEKDVTNRAVDDVVYERGLNRRQLSGANKVNMYGYRLGKRHWLLKGKGDRCNRRSQQGPS